MITMTWTDAPADLFGLGGAALHPCSVVRSGMRADVAMVAPIAQFQGTGLPTGGTVVRLREAVRTVTPPFAHNYIGAKNDGTTLGNHTLGRPLS